MILVDTGPLIALIDSGQGEAHFKCVRVCNYLECSMLTTLPCFTEAMYFLSELKGWRAQNILWQFIERKELYLHFSDEFQLKRIKILMEKYQDVPMDFADASLVAAAETRKLKRIFTLDSDFYIYRINNKDSFEVIPTNY